ncbi:siderophore-interacting protein [Rhodococcus sp. NPDC058521]|uniref:siderophore-interacting protein n=1 Tax=Rhodococcus sp. NPDC058521 TaxID=3346536 RepID=UPI003648A012
MAKPATVLTVARTEQLTPHMIRVHLGGPGFDSFTPNEFTDMYVKLVFGSGDDAVVRTYTIRSVDPVRREIAIDFVVHGDVGVAGPWAAAAQAGDEVEVRGPGGAFAPDPAADWYLLAGDETAIPAISAAVERLESDAVGNVLIEVGGSEDEVPLPAPAGVEVRWIHRGVSSDQVDETNSGDNAPLIEAVRSLPWRAGQPHVFVHGEAQAVMTNVRPYVRKERGVSSKSASISGYWRKGRTEEGFRVWKSEFAAAEQG